MITFKYSAKDIDSLLEENKRLKSELEASNTYYKDYIYLNDWTCYVMEQTEPVGTDKYHYELVFYPERIIPDIDVK